MPATSKSPLHKAAHAHKQLFEGMMCSLVGCDINDSSS